MISSYFLNLLYSVISALISPITSQPNVTLDPTFSSNFVHSFGYITAMNAVLPIVALFAAVGIIVFVEGAIFIYKGIMWIVKKIPTIN